MTDYNFALSRAAVERAVRVGIKEAACALRGDYFKAVEAAWKHSSAHDGEGAPSRETSVLRQILDNYYIATEQSLPICQDTGSVWVCLEVGRELALPPDILGGVNEAVAAAYTEARLRKSIVRDALVDRTNTGDNTPAFCEINFVEGASARVHIMLKGGGSDNASRLVMLPPAAGFEGIKREVLACVREKAANACPPLVIGVGVGATFDKVAGLAKHALLRKVGTTHANEQVAAYEADLLAAVNATGIGAGALGGEFCALAVHIETAPCHIAALPLAINMGCCAMRSATIELVDEQGRAIQNPAASTWEPEGVL
jgi:fumarate hydratase class I/fumarate hydratase subunit alpha